jgi:hypothetical protein
MSMVGPCSYETNVSSFKSAAEPDEPWAYNASRAAFMSSSRSSRFGNSSNNANNTPAPGHHQQLTNVAVDLTRTQFGRPTPFGSTSKRFKKKKPVARSASAGATGSSSGGAEYTQQKQLVGRSRPTAAFHSRTKRFVPPAAADDAPLMSRSLLKGSVVIKDPQRNSSAFKSGSGRFGGERLGRRELLQRDLGPGTYNVSRSGGAGFGSSKKCGAGSAFQARDMRFRPTQDLGVPGPGYYGDSSTNSFIRPSFNVTVDGFGKR